MNVSPVSFPSSPSFPLKSATDLQATIVYRDIQAGQHAAGMIPRILGSPAADNTGLTLRVQFWRFDLLAYLEFRTLAAADLDASDLIIIADGTPAPLEPSLENWLEQAFGNCAGGDHAVIAIFGPSAGPDEPTSPRLRFVRDAATNAGLGFFAPLPQPRETAFLRRENIHRQAETMTPTLDRILNQPARPYFPGHGTN